MRFINRVVFALSIAGLVSMVLRLMGKDNPPQQQGGWREVTPNR